MSDIFDGHDKENHNEVDKITHVSGMFKNWFIDYASYVILERAVPAMEDGLKPVQRRILHSMWELEDGRYNKVANLIGNTMKYHPHGDASIGDALVAIGQKDLLIDCQGNWGNILTGDSAAAPRYIEARLSKFGQEVIFNPKTTNWGLSYDGRNKEPITLPVKFPLVLAQGVEGIAVGLATKILPHNFNELIDASIQILKGKKAYIYPDFITGGIADFSDYKDGLRGGKIKIRARVKELNPKTLIISEIPFGTTTGSLIDSIIAANDKGKIKIKKVEDNTSENVEILIHLQPGISTDKTIDALYAFTNCEMSISPNACIIEGDKPRFIGVSEILKISTHQTLELLKRELEIEQLELEEKWHFASLEKIFIKDEMYIDFKKYSNKETLFEYLYERFKPYKKKLIREINDEDLHRLTQIPMIRITRFDSIKAEAQMKELDEKIAVVKNHLANLIEYAVEYFKTLKKKYGTGRERKTETKQLETIVATEVIMANEKLYVNRAEGFIGISLKKDEFVTDCSNIDDIIAFTKDGKMKVCKVSDKVFIGKDIIYVAIFKKNDERTTYNMIYSDGPKGITFIKRFNVTGVTREKEYNLTKGTPNSAVHWFTVNPNGEAEKVMVILKPLSGVRKLELDIDFAEIPIKARTSLGNIVTKYSVKKVVLKEKGTSTLEGEDYWFDETIHRINKNEKGTYLGKFSGDDKILTVTTSGFYKLYTYDVLNHFDEDTVMIEKYFPNQTLTCIYYDGISKSYFTKRFAPENTTNKTLIITENEQSRIELITAQINPIVEVKFAKEKGVELPEETIKMVDFSPLVNIKAKGKKLSSYKVKEINLKEPEEIKAARKFLKNSDDEKTGLSPVELHRRAMEKLSKANNKDFLDGDGQITFEF
ncbi:MAG: DNA gyrase/topoisomerase IV subunit A [Bacteroidota bacterium]|nr:DNA gyrase/topoisomerase IV subunit A [Bacteroidota bacterium]MDP3143971.1 DNA gyrase/topoisomerase IV subunit A [Bacteroidota bacterium]